MLPALHDPQTCCLESKYNSRLNSTHNFVDIKCANLNEVIHINFLMTLGLQNVAEESVLWLHPMSVSKVHKKELDS